MSDADILAILKADLDIGSTTARDSYLNQLITTAKAFIQREGITYDSSSAEDGALVEMYAGYLYRKRRENEPMPRSLRWALNNRLLSEKGAVDDG